jgi:hypothetical protein
MQEKRRVPPHVCLRLESRESTTRAEAERSGSTATAPSSDLPEIDNGQRPSPFSPLSCQSADEDADVSVGNLDRRLELCQHPSPCAFLSMGRSSATFLSVQVPKRAKQWPTKSAGIGSRRAQMWASPSEDARRTSGFLP